MDLFSWETSPEGFRNWKYAIAVGLVRTPQEWGRLADAFFPGNKLSRDIRCGLIKWK